jgi:hypothetical protein
MGEEINSLIKKLESSSGYLLNSKAYVLETSFIMMVLNYAEFDQYTENVPIFYRDAGKTDEARKFMLNAGRFATNFLTSACAFKGHTLKFMRNIYVDVYGLPNEKAAFSGAYGEKIQAEFANDSLSQFVEDIRNFAEHYSVLPVSCIRRIRDGDLHTTLGLDKESLIQSGYEWRKGASYLEENDEIELRTLLQKYMYKSIFPWIIQQQAQAHEPEFDNLMKQVQILKSTLERHQKQN